MDEDKTANCVGNNKLSGAQCILLALRSQPAESAPTVAAEELSVFLEARDDGFSGFTGLRFRDASRGTALRVCDCEMYARSLASFVNKAFQIDIRT